MMNTVSIFLTALLLALGIGMLLMARNIRVMFRSREELTRKSPRRGSSNSFGKMARYIKNLTEGAGIELLPREVVLLSVLMGVIPFLLFQVLGASFMGALVSALIGFLSMPMILMLQRRRNLSRFEDQLGNAMPLIASNLRAGLTLRQALIPVGENMEDPLRSEFFRVAEEVSSGRSMSQALDDLSDRVESEDLRLFATAVSIQEKQGGSIADIVEQVGSTVRVRLEMRQFVKSKTSMAKSSATVMTIMPLIMFVAIMLISETHRKFYLTTDGMVLILVCVLMGTFGWLVMSKMSKIA